MLALLLLLPVLPGCQKVQARIELKKGNELYKNETYKEALAQFERGLQLDPSATFAWRSVGFSALALYKPGDKSPENVGYANTAVDAFQKYLNDYPDDQKVSDYLTSILVSSGRHEEALARLRAAAAAHPEDPGPRRTIVSVLLDSGRLQEARDYVSAPTTPKDPQMYYSVGVSAWAKSYNDYMMDNATRGQVVDMGMDMLQKAIALKPDYAEAMSYLNLLYRERASKVELDPVKQQEWLAEANKWRDKAIALFKQQQAAQKAAEAAAANKS